jgi:hypothetical protein
MHRDKFPEKIPFRLTRMLTSAMEVCGIEGTFRFTCESVMRVMRHDKGSVMAMLEAFVHDPLINWRLLGNDLTVKPSDAARADAPSSHAVGLDSAAAAASGGVGVGVGVGAGGGDAGGGVQEVAPRSHSHALQAPQLIIGALGNEAYTGEIRTHISIGGIAPPRLPSRAIICATEAVHLFLLPRCMHRYRTACSEAAIQVRSLVVSVTNLADALRAGGGHNLSESATHTEDDSSDADSGREPRGSSRPVCEIASILDAPR